MSRILEILRDDRGVAFVMAMIMLVAMTGLMLAFLSVSAFEPQISQNLATTSEARFVADAGLEWAFDQLATVPPAVLAANGGSMAYAQTAHWNTLLATPGTPLGKITGALPMPIPDPAGSMPAAFGTFVVVVRNDTQASDRLITGVPPDPAAAAGTPPSDINGVIVVTSTGTVRGVSRTVTAAVRRPPPLNFDFNGAVSFPGTQADVGFTGNSFEISGEDWKMPPAGATPATPDGVNPAVWGIAVSSEFSSHESDVENQLTGQQQDNVTGRRENPGQPGQGTNTINKDPGATMAAVHDFISAIGKLPPSSNIIKHSSSSADPLHLSNQTFGSETDPVIVHVKGTEPDPTSKFTALTLSGGTVGYGILIVEDGDLKINGNFRWNGPIIVSGGYVGVGFMGGGEQSVYGAVVSNEMSSDEKPGFLEGLFAGNAKIRYSKEALDNAVNNFFNKRSSFQMYSWREN